jgi:hypothetical protein
MGAITYPNTDGTSNQVLTTDGAGIASWSTPTSVTVGSLGTATANAASITNGILSLTPADGTNPGIVTTDAQTFAGAKTFNSDITVNGINIGKGLGSVATNTAIGNLSLSNNTTGDENTAIGIQTLLNNTSGFSNTALGLYALKSNTTGSRNTAIGSNTLLNNTIGGWNTALGRAALIANTEGNYNIGVGFQSLLLNTTGSNNIAIGYQAFAQNTTGSNNTAIGHLAAMVNGISNATAIGNGAVVYNSNTIQLGNSSVTNVKTSGTLTAGAVTYPNTDGSANQVLATDGAGNATWVTPAASGFTHEVSDELTATASQASFILSNTPGANSKVKMYINGIRISNTAYSISGTTLSYDSTKNGAYTISVGDRIQFDFSY